MSDVAPGSPAGGWARFDGDPVVATRAAELMREEGDLLGAAALLIRISAAFPHLPYGWRELAVMRQRADDAAGAARCFERALAADPGSPLTLTQMVRHAAGTGRLDAAEAHLAAFVARSAAAERDAERLAQLVDFMRRHPLADALACTAAMEAHPTYLDTHGVEARITAAMAERRPFSLVRLGDGEGAWISDPDEEEGRFRALYRHSRRHSLRTWFASDALLDRPDFLLLRGRMLAAIAGASILGITTTERIRHEYGLASPDGAPSSMNVLRHVRPLLGEGNRFFCSQDMHMNLQDWGYLHRFMDTAPALGVISCHPGLAAAISRRARARLACALLIPEEKAFSHVIGPNGSVQAHFPAVFHHVVSRLRAGDWSGTVWFVAAGYLGKIYCHEIALAGGIALDIGSVADAWSGKDTRPGFSELSRYRLSGASPS